MITIESECARSAQLSGLEQLHLIPGILGEAIIPTGAERVDTAIYRYPTDASSAHLGEAETCAIILNRSLAARFVSDDLGAIRLAQSLGIETFTTADLLRLAVRVGFVTSAEGWRMLAELFSAHRVVPFAPHTQDEFTAWCV